MNTLSLWTNRLKKYFIQSMAVSNEINKEGGGNTLVIYFDILFSALVWGATVEDYQAMEFYRKSWHERNQFVTAYRNFIYFYKRMCDKRAVDVFNNKQNFNKVFSELVRRDWLYSKDMNKEAIRKFINEHQEVVVKLTNSAEGNGIYKLLAPQTKKVNELFEKIDNGENFMIEELIVSHPKVACLNPSSVNTIRVETVIDSKGQVHITNSLIIIGTNDCIVNNTHHGGIMCHVDWKTGVIDSFGRTPKGEKFFRHPSSGFILPGYQLPNWDGINEYVHKLAKVVPSARLIGWDIVIQDDGYEVIEGNVRPGHCTQACDGIGRWKLIKSYI